MISNKLFFTIFSICSKSFLSVTLTPISCHLFRRLLIFIHLSANGTITVIDSQYFILFLKMQYIAYINIQLDIVWLSIHNGTQQSMSAEPQHFASFGRVNDNKICYITLQCSPRISTLPIPPHLHLHSTSFLIHFCAS